VRRLLSKGADVAARSVRGNSDTALLNAFSSRGSCTRSIVEVLIASGADASDTDKNGDTTVLLSASATHDETMEILKLLVDRRSSE
jgi:ankyrin repeat protein